LAPPRKRRLCLPLAFAAALSSLAIGAAPASANVISPPPSHSPGTDQITTLYWIAIVVIVALIVIINGALIYAVRRYRSERGAEPRQIRSGRGIQVRAVAILGILALALFVAGIVYTDKARQIPTSGPNGVQTSSFVSDKGLRLPADASQPLVIRATGQQWLWRYEYPNGAFSYYNLVVPVDTAVELDIVSTDVVHSWYVPELAGKADAVPGKLNKVYFRADKEASFAGESAQFSGQAYAAMRTEVDVVSPDQYAEFIKAQKREIQAAQTHVVAQIKNGKIP
jgi:cytochrome c oxidase subunit 2